MENKDIWKLWADQRDNDADDNDDVNDLLKESDDPEITADRPGSAPKKPDMRHASENENQDVSLTSMRRPTPLLSGRLANHLAEQVPRAIHTRYESFKFESAPIVLTDPQEKAVVAMSLVLASHLTRFATTRFPEETLTTIRDKILHGFEAREAVRIEVEAYDLLNWFAGAMNPEWQMRQPESAEITPNETSEKALLEIIEKAIREQRDLKMRYYTGSRGEFSERMITPIAVTAEKYLVAYCHLRGEERVFRLSRIVQLTPVSDNPNEELPMAYPSKTDTQLPPLPDIALPAQTPSVQPQKKNFGTKNKKSADDSQKSKKKSASSKTETGMPPGRSLFDFAQTKTEPALSLLDIMKLNQNAAEKVTPAPNEEKPSDIKDDIQETEHKTPRIPGL